MNGGSGERDENCTDASNSETELPPPQLLSSSTLTSFDIYVAALVGIFPLLYFFVWEFGYLSIPYMILHLLSGPLAVKLSQHDDANGGYKRWFGGFVVTMGLSGIKTIAVLRMNTASLLKKMILYVASSLWECSNGAMVFGGRSVLRPCCIDSVPKSVVAVLSPGQVKFVQEPCSVQSWLIRSIHLTCFFVTYVTLRTVFSCISSSTLESNPLLEAEAIVLLLSCIVMIWDVPSHVWQLAMIRYPVQVIYPYGAVYFSTSMRMFWSKWSRPASQLIRYAIYYPLGGVERVGISIPILFLLNAASHYDVSNALVGNRAEMAWNVIFGVLGITTLAEILGNRYIGGTRVAYRVLRALVAHGALMFAAYTLVHKCLQLSLSSFL